MQDRKQHDYFKFFALGKKDRHGRSTTNTRASVTIQLELTQKEEAEYSGYVPSKTKEPPRMFINPTEDELKEMIRQTIHVSPTNKKKIS